MAATKPVRISACGCGDDDGAAARRRQPAAVFARGADARAARGRRRARGAWRTSTRRACIITAGSANGRARSRRRACTRPRGLAKKQPRAARRPRARRGARSPRSPASSTSCTSTAFGCDETVLVHRAIAHAGGRRSGAQRRSARRASGRALYRGRWRFYDRVALSRMIRWVALQRSRRRAQEPRRGARASRSIGSSSGTARR